MQEIQETTIVKTNSGMVVDERKRLPAYLQYPVKEKNFIGGNPTIPLRCFCQYYLKCILLLITVSNLKNTCLVVRYL
jgi:hypothetical protein